jgi:TonB-linked SusC/RagA family outer membrane protein
MRRLLLIMLSMLMISSQLLAQNRTITGKVTDPQGNGVPNTSVTVKGTTIGTTTSSDGSFSLNVPANSQTLTFSAIGFGNQEVAIGSNNSINLTLSPVEKGLDEVVVTAYGGTQKKAFTGTASTIKAEKFKDLQVTTLTGVLQGNASGVLSVSSNGQPGVNPVIRIRGIGSVNASSDPLIVVDGAPYGGNINAINPNDVETITILKDASSIALYGNRGANGVIQITTKSGRGAPKVSFSALSGYSKRAIPDYELLNANQLYELTWEALRNDARDQPSLITSSGSVSAEDYASRVVVSRLVYNPFGIAEPVGLDGKIKSDAKLLWNDNWYDALLRTGVRNDYNVSISSGSEKTKYYFSGGYLKDQGIVTESAFKRYTGRLKVDSKINDWFTAGLNTNLSFSTQNYPVQGGAAYSNVIGFLRGISSLYPIYKRDLTTGEYILDANGNKQYDFGETRPASVFQNANPAGTTSMNPTTNDRFITSANAYGEAQIIKDLKFRTQYALDYFQFASNVYYNPFVGDGRAYGGRSEKSRENIVNQTFTNTLTYDKNFLNLHHVNLVVGMEAFKYTDATVTAEKRGFTFPGVTELDYGSALQTSSSNSFENRTESYFGRLNYDLTDKYHISVSLRRDGTSRFADSVRWGTFYSVGTAWNINRENFMQGLEFLSDLKLRASYGTTGNQGLSGYFPYLSTYSSGWDVLNNAGSVVGTLGNGGLTWETQKQWDLGLDLGFLKNRITGSFTYFIRNSDNLLFSRPLPSSIGISSISDNVGEVQNSGYEIDLNTINITKKDFEWRTSINFTHTKNKMVIVPAGSTLKEGKSLYEFFIREYAGVDATDGKPMWYKDVTGSDGKIIDKVVTKTYADATRYYVGSSLPDYTGGISNTVRYKGFDLSVLAAFNLGGKIYDADYASLFHGFSGLNLGLNASADILGRWQDVNNRGDGKTPKLTTADLQANSSSTRFLYDADYLRVRNITLGYTIPSNITQKARINNARFFVDLQNPFTLSKGPIGLDPEAGLSGTTNSTSSAYKTISIGVNLEF